MSNKIKNKIAMKKIGVIMLMAAAALTAGSCGSKGGGQPQEQVDEEPDSTVTVSINRDSTVYGICIDGSAMNTLQLLTDVGDTLSLSIAEANSKGKCYGGFQVGDRMALMLKDENTAKLVINQSALLGDWVMPNPLDGSSEMGIRIKEGGIAESIDQPAMIYRSWRIFNGKLEIVAIRDGGGDMMETNLYELVAIGPDSLVFRDAEDLYEYSRQVEHHYKVDIQLEEASEDDYRM